MPASTQSSCSAFEVASALRVLKKISMPLAKPFIKVSLATAPCARLPTTVSLAQDGMGLGTMWGKEKALEMLKEAGFDNIEVKELEHDIQNYYYIANKN